MMMANWFSSPLLPTSAVDWPSLTYASAAVTVIIIVTVTVITTICSAVRKTRENRYLPPGPPRVPLLGNLHQLGAGYALPHHTMYKLSQKYGPMMRLQLGERLAVVISSPEMAKEVLRTKELSFAHRPDVVLVEILSYNYSGLIFSPYGDYWRRVRKICVSELLSAKQVRSFRSVREAEVRDLVAAISAATTGGDGGAVVNLTDLLFVATNNITARAAFGMRCKDGEEFLALLKEANKIGAGFSLPDFYPSLKFLRHVTGMHSQLERIHGRIDRILDDVVTQHLLRDPLVNGGGQEEEDLVGMLIKLQCSDEVDSRLTTQQIKAVTLDIFSGGSETSSTTMEWAMAELMNNPTAMAKMQAELRQAFKGKSRIEENDLQHMNMCYLRAIIKETLRLHPSAPMVPRKTREVPYCEVAGYRIPPDTMVLINAYAIGRDPKAWPEPHCFKPERFVGSTVDFVDSSFQLIPFGGGRRICPGLSFATANIELLLAQLLYHFDWRLPNGVKVGELDMSESFGFTLRRKGSLHLIPTVVIPFCI